MRFKRGVLNS